MLIALAQVIYKNACFCEFPKKILYLLVLNIKIWSRYSS